MAEENGGSQDHQQKGASGPSRSTDLNHPWLGMVSTYHLKNGDDWGMVQMALFCPQNMGFRHHLRVKHWEKESLTMLSQ
jgi:hypothetical protein